jgi:hypothetical protein
VIPLTGSSAPIAAAAARPATAVTSVIARAQLAPVPVITLTDEELAALDGPRALPVAPQPWLEGQKVSGRMLACQVALRSLAARGIVLPAGLDAANAGNAGNAGDGGALPLHQDLRAVLAMRRSALGIVLAQRRTGAERQSRMLYLHEGGALEEDISAAGLHGLTVVSSVRAGERLASFTDPARVAGDDRAVRSHTVSLAEIATGADISGLRGARFVTAVGRLFTGPDGQSEEQRVTVYAHADRVVLAEPVTTAEGDHSLAFTEVSAHELGERMAGFVRAG